MPDENGWFDAPISNESPLEQGDILYSVPSARIEFSDDDALDFNKPDGIKVKFKLFNCIILSQSCDINGQKSSKDLSVMLAPLYERNEYDAAKPGLLQNHILELMRQGKMPSHHMLNSCDIEGFKREISIVDFRQAFSLPLDLLRTLVTKGMKRIRLKSPYSEHLGAAYGRSIMRVGLPVDIPKFPVLAPAIDKFATQFSAMSADERVAALEQLKELNDLKIGEE